MVGALQGGGQPPMVGGGQGGQGAQGVKGTMTQQGFIPDPPQGAQGGAPGGMGMKQNA